MTKKQKQILAMSAIEGSTRARQYNKEINLIKYGITSKNPVTSGLMTENGRMYRDSKGSLYKLQARGRGEFLIRIK